MIDNRRVVTNAQYARYVFNFNVFRQMIYQAEFTQ